MSTFSKIGKFCNRGSAWLCGSDQPFNEACLHVTAVPPTPTVAPALTLCVSCLRLHVMFFCSAQLPLRCRLLAPLGCCICGLSSHLHCVAYITALILKIAELRLNQRKGLAGFTQKISGKAGSKPEPSYLASMALPVSHRSRESSLPAP